MDSAGWALVPSPPLLLGDQAEKPAASTLRKGENRPNWPNEIPALASPPWPGPHGLFGALPSVCPAHPLPDGPALLAGAGWLLPTLYLGPKVPICLTPGL